MPWLGVHAVVKVLTRLIAAVVVSWLLMMAALAVPLLFLSDPRSDQSPLSFDADAGEVWKVGIRAPRPAGDAAEILQSSGFAVVFQGTDVGSDSHGGAMTEYEDDSVFYFVEFVSPAAGAVEVRVTSMPSGGELYADDGKHGWFVFWFVCAGFAFLLFGSSVIGLMVAGVWCSYQYCFVRK